MLKSSITGKIGEALAYNFLKNKKYKILATNYFSNFGEIDIIAKFKKTLVFVEVKTRTTKAFNYGMDAVGLKKQSNIKLTASQYVKENYKKKIPKIRYDVISILGDDIEHIENAFE